MSIRILLATTLGLALCAGAGPVANAACSTSNGKTTCTANSPRTPMQFYSRYDQPEDHGQWLAGSGEAIMKDIIYQRGQKTKSELDALNLISSCSSSTAGWPSGCTPERMASVIDTNAPNTESWVAKVTADQSTPMGYQCYHLYTYGFPFAVPLYGHADHWGFVYEMRFTSPPTTSNCSFDRVKFYEGLLAEQYDDSGSNGFTGAVSKDSVTWLVQYYKMMNSSQLSGTSYYDKWVLIYEPPTDLQFAPNPEIRAEVALGIVGVHERMNTLKARQRVMDALLNADFTDDPELWTALQETVPAPASFVEGFTPAGEADDYYHVPLLDREGNVAYVVQLDDEDGHWTGLLELAEPQPYRPRSADQVHTEVSGLLKQGEKLGDGQLVFDPRSEDRVARNAFNPLWTFDVLDQKGRPVGEVQVPLFGGKALLDSL